MATTSSSQPLASVELPKYKCHKEVHAAQIIRIEEYESAGAWHKRLVFDDASLSITDAWFDHFKPEVGGYYVVYEDGYDSFSPAAAFEAGYTRL